MSYQPPFDGNWMTEYARLTRRDQPPPSIRYAVRFIYAGAAITALFAILAVAGFRIALQSFLARESITPLMVSQLNTYATLYEVGLSLGGAIGVSLWLWMAVKNRAGRRWARTFSSVLFAISTVSEIGALLLPVPVAGKIIPVAAWLVGLLAIVLLWQRESSDFYDQRSGRY
jgi:hypothetical protein